MYPDDRQSKFIYSTCLLTIFPTLYVFYKNIVRLVLMSLVVFITSILHWKNPKHNSLARYLDITCVFGGITYSITQAVGTRYQAVYYLFLLLGGMSYAISNHLLRIKKYWPSVYFHSAVHVLVNSGLLIWMSCL